MTGPGRALSRPRSSSRVAAALASLYVLILVLVVPAIASACPACAREEGGPVLLSVYATMVITPFFAVAIAWRVIRSLTGTAGGEAAYNNRSSRPLGDAS